MTQLATKFGVILQCVQKIKKHFILQRRFIIRVAGFISERLIQQWHQM